MDARSLRVLNRETRRNELFQRKTYDFPYVHRNAMQSIYPNLDPYNPENNSNVKSDKKNSYNDYDPSNTIPNYESIKPTAVYLRYANILAVDLSGSSIALSPSPADPTELNDVSGVTLPPLENVNAEPESSLDAPVTSVTPVSVVVPVKIPSVKVPMQCCTIS